MWLGNVHIVSDKSKLLLAFLNISPGEPGTRLENSNLFTCYASNHLCSYPRSKPMSNDPGLDLDHHVSLIGSCSLVAHHVPQHIFQSVVCWLNIQSGRMPHSRIYSQRCALQYPPMVTIFCTGFPVTVTSKIEFVQSGRMPLFESISCYVAFIQIV